MLDTISPAEQAQRDYKRALQHKYKITYTRPATEYTSSSDLALFKAVIKSYKGYKIIAVEEITEAEKTQLLSKINLRGY